LTKLSKDIDRMRSLGTTAYRLSLAWSRIMPTGRPPVEPRGLAHYTKVLSILKRAGIEPYVTLFHFDLPSGLEKEGGWLNASTAASFREYARVCFAAFGDSLVKQWITINEPHTIVTAG